MKQAQRLTPKKVGQFIRQIRIGVGFTQTQLARRMRVTSSRLNKIESGEILPNILQWLDFINATNYVSNTSKWINLTYILGLDQTIRSLRKNKNCS